MSKKDKKTSRRASGSPCAHDIERLLQYDGPSLRVDSLIEDGVEIISYRDTDDNVRHLTALLSSQSIRFYLKRSKRGWTGLWPRMILIVPANQYSEAAVLLDAAVEASVLDVVEGPEGLYSR